MREVTQRATTRVRGRDEVDATGTAAVTASDNAVIYASGASRVRATDDATVIARDTSTTVVGGRARAVASARAVVRAFGDATVDAWEHTTVYAHERATVRAHGPGPVVHVMSEDATVVGGTQVTAPLLTDPEAWCASLGVVVTAGVATLYKAVTELWEPPVPNLMHPIDYSPGSLPHAPDWQGHAGPGGLYFSPAPYIGLGIIQTAVRFISAGVLKRRRRAAQSQAGK